MIHKSTLLRGAALVAASFVMPGSPARALHAQHADPKQSASTGQGQEAAASGPAQRPTCPVMDEPVDFTVKAMTEQGPVYFCCDSCIEKFQKDHMKYADKVAGQRAALAKMQRIQVSCPVDGKSVDGKLNASVAGRSVSFCSKDCMASYEKSPATYKAKLEDSYAYQIHCPVSGETIDPTVYTDLSTGQRIYFCCKDCTQKLLTDPAKYAPKLAEQGINIDVKKLSGAAKGPAEKGHDGHDHDHDGH